VRSVTRAVRGGTATSARTRKGIAQTSASSRIRAARMLAFTSALLGQRLPCEALEPEAGAVLKSTVGGLEISASFSTLKLAFAP
jgi:hypothetical protein